MFGIFDRQLNFEVCGRDHAACKGQDFVARQDTRLNPQAEVLLILKIAEEYPLAESSEWDI
jgi:hypothetical protein